ncbi:MAG: carboxypeptidase-like regulatory domain-containing protein, partial [Longimicrobiales bacterium]
FSTGAPVANTALAGVVFDRITGDPAPLGVVDAVHRAQGARYTAIADSSGFYSLRYLPVGEYDVRAYDDQNRNRRRDRIEPVDSGYTVLFAEPTDTVTLIFNVLSPDTSAPRVMAARALDSLHVRLVLDDYVDPGAGFEAVRTEVSSMPDSIPFAAGIRIVPEIVFNEEQSAAADTAAQPEDTAGVRRDTTGVGVEVDAAALPVRELVVRLDRPLVPGSYTITVSGVVNLHGLAGGGSARFDVSEPEPPPPPAPPDTARSGPALRP